MSFRLKYICDKCDTEFKNEPSSECPVCIEVCILNKLIDDMKTEKDYREVKRRINSMEDSNHKFDLYNKCNTKHTKLFCD